METKKTTKPPTSTPIPPQTPATASAKRPKFLTVLCILSFVGVGLSIIFGVFNYLTYAAASSLTTAALDAAGGAAKEGQQFANAFADALGIDYGKLKLVTLIQILLNLPILAGVILMWKQKKLGYFIYAPIELIQAALPLIMGLGLLGGATAIISIVFAITFIVLYGINLKHMQGGKKKEDAAQTATPTTDKPVTSKPTTANTTTTPAAAGTFYEVRLSNVSCNPVGATYKVGMTVIAKKFVVDKTGKEKEEIINDEIQIGMVKNGKEIYLKSYRFTKTTTALSLTLDQKPDKIGVDPYNKLAERV